MYFAVWGIGLLAVLLQIKHRDAPFVFLKSLGFPYLFFRYISFSLDMLPLRLNNLLAMLFVS
jgi:hypothetical protein